ncbi:MAG: glycosyltransferase family 4 protein [Candidatus Diapherotrites archaeon]
MSNSKFSAAVLYPYPLEMDGVSLQGYYLAKGLAHHGYKVYQANRRARFEKEFIYKHYKPNFAIGIGFWGDLPQLSRYTQKYDITLIPWLNADGWVANYHETIESLPLVFTTSNWVKETYIRDGLSGKNLVPMPIGIDTEEMKPIPKDDPRVISMRKLLGVKEDEIMILTAGGDVTSKGFQEVLKALGKINGKYPKWRYVGKSWESYYPTYHYRDELEIIKKFGFENKIEYIDGNVSRETFNVLLSAADIYAAPSRIEGFVMIQVEAMACGIPVLSIDAGGIKDTIIHNKTGFLAKVSETIDLDQEWVYPEMGFEKKQIIKFDKPKTFAYRADVDELAEYLLKLMENPDLRKKMGENGRKHAVENFDYKVTSLKMAKIIEKTFNL